MRRRSFFGMYSVTEREIDGLAQTALVMEAC